MILCACLSAVTPDTGAIIRLVPEATCDHRGNARRIGPESGNTPAEASFERQYCEPVHISILLEALAVVPAKDLILTGCSSCAWTPTPHIKNGIMTCAEKNRRIELEFWKGE